MTEPNEEKVDVETPAPDAPADPSPSPAPSSWPLWGKVAFIAFSCATLTVVAYHMGVRSSVPPPIATVDLQAVVEAKELQFTDLVTRPGVTDVERERAYQLVAKMAGELETAVAELRKDCKCLVLVRAAVVGAPDTDLTPALKQKMGVADLDVAALRDRLRQTRMTPGAIPDRGDGGQSGRPAR